MTNNKIDFYVLKLKGCDNEVTIEPKDVNGVGMYQMVPIFGVKDLVDDDVMTEVFTGKKISKSSSDDIENILTYTESRVANSKDLRRMVELLNLINKGYDVVTAFNVVLENNDAFNKTWYDQYISDLSKASEFYVNNMNNLNRK